MRKISNKPSSISLRFYKELVDIMTKARRASHKVLQENKELGIPSPFSLHGIIYYLMPDGRIVRKRK